MTFGSLFAGIGGLDLGLERAGMKCVWQVEINEYCQRVLAKHWPTVRRHSDVCTFPPEGDWNCELICGGFPCQDISTAGQRAGITGERSGLWSEMLRVISVVRPRYVLLENVAALLHRGMETVLSGLSAIGYDAEWDTLSACQFGAPHTRERVFVVAYTDEVPRHSRLRIFPQYSQEAIQPNRIESLRRDWLQTVSGVARGFDGLPDEVDRIEGCGNAVVPVISEWIGRRILGTHENK